jgi:hypothetical protein
MFYLYESGAPLTRLRDLFKKHKEEKLLEARVGLLEKGIYPFDVFLKEHSEAVRAAETIEQLEQVAETYKSVLPTLHLFVTQNSATLMESKIDPNSIEAAMVNYSFVSEALGKCVNEAARILDTKHQKTQTLKGIYGDDAVKLLEFCIGRAESHKLMEGDTSTLVRFLAKELAELPVGVLKQLTESIPSVRLYVSNRTHNELANIVIAD